MFYKNLFIYEKIPSTRREINNAINFTQINSPVKFGKFEILFVG